MVLSVMMCRENAEDRQDADEGEERTGLRPAAFGRSRQLPAEPADDQDDGDAVQRVRQRLAEEDQL